MRSLNSEGKDFGFLRFSQAQQMSESLAGSSPKALKPEVQFLRAFAVLAVIGYHFWPNRLPGGFVGVDVFFVISGFLISEHILRQVESGTFSFAKFYARRIRRILPAALLVLGVTLFGIVLISSPINWQNFASQTAASALFVENWFLSFLSVDYLGALADPSPVQHFWSLSVEEQFYLFWPLIVVTFTWLITKFRSRKPQLLLGLSIGVVFFASLGFSIMVTEVSPVSGFFNTFGRVWEFALGALLAVVLKNFSLPPPMRVFAALLGWATLLTTLFVITNTMPFPGYLALVPTLGAGLVITAGSPAATTRWRWLYRNRLVLLIGAVSYSAYLWHWPVLIFSQELLQTRPSTMALMALLLVTFVLAYGTTRFIENPFRFGKALNWSTRQVIIGGLASITIVASVASIPWVAIERGVTANLSEPASAAVEDVHLCVGAQAMDPNNDCVDGPYVSIVPNVLSQRGAISFLQETTPQCAATRTDTAFFTCEFGNPNSQTRVALVGDSHAMKIFPAINELAKANDWSLTLYLRGACAWNSKVGEESCTTFRAEVSARLAAQRWSAVFVTGQDGAAAPAETYRQLWRPVIKNGSPIVVIRDNPALVEDARVCILDAQSVDNLEECSVARSGAFQVDFQALAVETNPGSLLVDLSDYYCDETRCPVMIGGIYVYRDKTHVNDEYSVTLAPYIQNQLMNDLPDIFFSAEK